MKNCLYRINCNSDCPFYVSQERNSAAEFICIFDELSKEIKAIGEELFIFKNEFEGHRQYYEFERNRLKEGISRIERKLADLDKG